MRNLTAGLKAHLAGDATTLCYCWRLIKNDGVSLGFTDHDRDITFDDILFEAASGLNATEATNSLGLATGGLDVAGALQSEQISSDDIEAAKLDNAKISVYLVNWNNPHERSLVAAGNIGEITREDGYFKAEIRSIAHVLDQQQGRIFQYGCDANLGDKRCKINIKNPRFSFNGQITSVVSRLSFVTTPATGHASGLFDTGLLTWKTGLNAGASSHVKRHVVENNSMLFGLWQLPTHPIANGDDFFVHAGCDRSFSTCQSVFSNSLNFRGFPHMPGNDFALSYPERNDARNNGTPVVK